jgi:hypothetical protein
MTDGPQPPTTDVHSLTAEQATAKLAEMKTAFDGPAPSANPQTANDARRRLEVLGRDAGWSTRFFNGDQEARREFNDLVQRAADGDPVADAMAPAPQRDFIIETTVDGALPQYMIRDAVADLRLHGISEGAIAEALSGEKVDAATHAAAKAFRAMRMSDPEWTEALARHDYRAVQELRLMSIILAPFRD